MRPKIAMWSDYGAPARKRWRSGHRRNTRFSTSVKILLIAGACIAAVIGIRGFYPQIIDAGWVRELKTQTQGVAHSDTAATSVGMGNEPQRPSPPRPGWVAQLVGDSSETEALSRFHAMQTKLQSALGGYEPAILRTTIKKGEAPIWVRVRIEFDTRHGANS
jgi:hypothetical protein